MNAHIQVQIALEQDLDLPPEESIKQWAQAALEEPHLDSETTIRVVDEVEITYLNRNFRDKDAPTNVLSFPFSGPENYNHILGDITLCAPIAAKEAQEQGIPLHNHWAHLIIHSMLHLQGYDHLIEEDAEEMEQKETAILAQFDIPDPYQS